jgi:probable rRNA maturation factor
VQGLRDGSELEMILNRQKKVPLAEQPLAEFLGRILREVKFADAEVSIAFVSDAEIAKWNWNYRNKKGPTDVLSFPALSKRRAEPHTKRNSRVDRSNGKSGVQSGGFLGDIAIAPETARRYAKKNGRTVDNEIRILMLHGILHLMGYDHESRSDYGQMNRIEQKLRRRLGLA